MKKILWLIIVGLIAFPIVSSSGFILDQRQSAIVFSMGEVKQVVTESGWHFKLPTPLQNVVFIDKRILTSDSTEPNRTITADKKSILIDPLIKWRVVDPKLYFLSFSGNEQRAQDRIAQIARVAFNEEIAKLIASEVISGDRARLMGETQKRMLAEAKNVGIDIVDVRLKRVDYTDAEISTVYARMSADRARLASEVRATGATELESIRTEADKQKALILAEGYRDAQKIRGEGDAKASRLYAQAFGQNPEFAKFYRSLEAYRASFSNRSDVMVLDTSSDFFKYMKNPKPSGTK